MKFIVSQSPTNAERFEYILQNNNGQTILTSPEFANRDACIAAIREVTTVVTAKSSYNVQSQGGQFVGVIRGANNQIIAQTTPSATAAVATAGIDTLLEDFSDETRYDVEVNTSTTTNQLVEVAALPTLGEIDYSTLYDFEYTSPKGNPTIEPFNRKDKGQYYFHINDTSGKALLYSRGFDSAGRRDKRIRQVIGASAKDQRYEIEEANGSYFLKLVERNGGEIARSRSFGSRAEAESASRYIKTTVPAFEAEYPEPEKTVKKALDQYNLSLTPANADAGFESLRGADKQYFFLMKNKSGVAEFFSQGYSSPAARDNGLRTVLKNAGEASRYEIKEVGGQYYYVLRSSNRQEIGRSKAFATKSEAEASQASMMANVREYAQKLGIDIDSLIKTVTTTDTESFSINLDTPSVAPVVGAVAAGLGAMALSGNAAAAAVPEVVVPEPVIEVPAAKIVVPEPVIEQPVIEVVPETVIEKPVVEESKIGLSGVAAAAAGLGAMALSGKVEASEPKVVVPEPVVEVAKPVAKVVPPVVEVAKPVIAKVVPPVVATEVAAPVAAYAAAEETAAAAGGGWWKWLLGAALLGALLWWLLKSCNGTPAAAPIMADSTQTTTTDTLNSSTAANTAASTSAASTVVDSTPAPVEAATAAAATTAAATAATNGGCNCAANADPLFNIDPNAKPKSLWRLGSNPEFGNSHALSPEQFYQKLKTRAATNAVDKKFLDRIFKAMGYKNSFAAADASMFTAVELPKGTIGNIGYSKAHKTLLASLDVVNDKDLKAFHIQSANGCDLHFMKTCGNHMFVCNK
jgi:uncharacterized protein YegP (UPF0339 family)